MAFTQKSLDFLAENRLQNSREWYAAHKDEYINYVLEPMRTLVEKLTPTMLTIDEQFMTEAKVDKTISRVYRDTRFSKDKSLYRENCWITFMRDKKLYMGPPAFYFDVSPAGFAYGMGYYMASPESAQSIRSMIVNGDASFVKAWKVFKTQQVFVLDGEKYKRSKYPEQSDELKDILDRKSLSFNCYSRDFDLLFSEHLAQKLAEDYSLLKEMYRFFIHAEAQNFFGTKKV